MAAVFVVIVNYRTPALAIECLASLQSELAALRGGRVVVVDNASGDDSIRLIMEAIEIRGWASWAELMALPRNGGFAYGNNRAIERVRDHDGAFASIVFLNPDAVVLPGCIATLVRLFDQRADVGIVGASLEDETGRRQRSAHVFPSAVSELEGAARLGPLSRMVGRRAIDLEASEVSCECDWVSGACFAVRRDLLDEIGGLDEGYFLYFEETDFCWRARRAGWACWYVPEVRVVHREGSATGIRARRTRRPAYWFASRRRFFARAYGQAGLALADGCWAIGRASLLLRRLLHLGGLNRDEAEPKQFFIDMMLGDVKAITRGELRDLQVVGATWT